MKSGSKDLLYAQAALSSSAMGREMLQATSACCVIYNLMDSFFSDLHRGVNPLTGVIGCFLPSSAP